MDDIRPNCLRELQRLRATEFANLMEDLVDSERIDAAVRLMDDASGGICNPHMDFFSDLWARFPAADDLLGEIMNLRSERLQREPGYLEARLKGAPADRAVDEANEQEQEKLIEQIVQLEPDFPVDLFRQQWKAALDYLSTHAELACLCLSPSSSTEKS